MCVYGLVRDNSDGLKTSRRFLLEKKLINILENARGIVEEITCSGFVG